MSSVLGLLREFEPVAGEKGLAYTVDVTPGTPTSLVTDHQRLRQILNNLLVNAFKFTERGSVHVQIGLADDGWDPDAVSLAGPSPVLAVSVRDTGIGIDGAQQVRIFEAFAQGDGTTSRLYGGTGLGLSICRELVRLLGGTIDVASASGEGSTFTVYLPIQGYEAPQATAPTSPEARVADEVHPDPPEFRAEHNGSPPGPRSSTRPFVPEKAGHATNGVDQQLDGVKILVVDDQPRNLFAITTLLERGHAEVTVVETGAAALAALEQAPDTDVVLMDIMMPVMDGYDTIRAIRTSEVYGSVTVIAVTGKVMAGERKRCLDAGADDYVPMPVDQAALFAAMRPWLAKAQQPVRPTSPSRHRVRLVASAPDEPTTRRGRRQRPEGTEGPRGRRRLPQHLRHDGGARTR